MSTADLPDWADLTLEQAELRLTAMQDQLDALDADIEWCEALADHMERCGHASVGEALACEVAR